MTLSQCVLCVHMLRFPWVHQIFLFFRMDAHIGLRECALHGTVHVVQIDLRDAHCAVPTDQGPRVCVLILDYEAHANDG